MLYRLRTGEADARPNQDRRCHGQFHRRSPRRVSRRRRLSRHRHRLRDPNVRPLYSPPPDLANNGSKKDTKSIIGTSGVRDILSALDKAGFGGAVPTVCIGGVNAANVKAVLAESDAGSGRRGLDGVAVVSAIMAAVDPAAAARDLVAKVVVAKLPSVIRAVAEKTPLSHNMTNLVSLGVSGLSLKAD